MFNKMNLIVGYGEKKLEIVKKTLGEDVDKYHILYKPENNWSPENYLKKLENYIIENKIKDNFIVITDNAQMAMCFDLIVCEMDLIDKMSYILINKDDTLSEYDDRDYLFAFFLEYITIYKDFDDYYYNNRENFMNFIERYRVATEKE